MIRSKSISRKWKFWAIVLTTVDTLDFSVKTNSKMTCSTCWDIATAKGTTAFTETEKNVCSPSLSDSFCVNSVLVVLLCWSCGRYSTPEVSIQNSSTKRNEILCLRVYIFFLFCFMVGKYRNIWKNPYLWYQKMSEIGSFYSCFKVIPW